MNIFKAALRAAFLLCAMHAIVLWG